MNILIQDETATGKLLQEITIKVSKEVVSVKELIKERLYAEVELHNKKGTDLYNGLVQPEESEKTLNGYKLKKGKQIDPEKQFYVALNAFQKNGFFILVNDRQVESLEENILLMPETKISFIKLTPLVGG